MSKILVTGATGNVGSRVVRNLLANGQAVRALARNGDSSRFDSKVEVVAGDFTNKDSLRKALDGISRVYLLAAGQNLSEYEANFMEVANKAKLELLVKHSVAGAQYKAADIPRWHRAGEELIEASGIPYVFLRPGSFSSNAFAWAETIKAQNTAYGALGDTSLPAIDPEDIAAVGAAVLTTEGHAGKSYDLSGPESLTSAQQVDIISEAVGRPLKYVNVPDNAAREAMLGMGMPPRYVEAMIDLIQTLRGIGRIEPSGDVESILGRKPRSFKQWAQENAAAFRPTQEAMRA